VIQGVLTGIGFLGMGVITHAEDSHKIHGLTTAACTWLTACVGMVCGLAAWPILIVGVILTFAVLFCGGPIEEFLHERFGRRRGDDGNGRPPGNQFVTPRISRASAGVAGSAFIIRIKVTAFSTSAALLGAITPFAR